MDIEWVEVAGGTCRFGENGKPVRVGTLLWTRTPVTHAQLRGDRASLFGLLPVTGLTHAQAAAIAREQGGRLPSSAEWEWMAAGHERRRWPWGDEEWRPGLANLHASRIGTTSPVNAHPDGATPEGLLDVAGNVWEWTRRPVTSNGVPLRGGSYASNPTHVRTTFRNIAPAELRSDGIGFRIVREP